MGAPGRDGSLPASDPGGSLKETMSCPQGEGMERRELREPAVCTRPTGKLEKAGCVQGTSSLEIKQQRPHLNSCVVSEVT